MNLTLAKRQPNRRVLAARFESTACDSCLGDYMHQPGVTDEQVTEKIRSQANDVTHLYNYFVGGGHGTVQFWLHPECAERLNRAVEDAVHPCCGVAAVDHCQC